MTQIPPTWGVEAQTPLLNALIARGDLNYIITAPTDKDQLVAPLQAALDAGIKVITVDTFLGDGDYVNGPVKFPISYIGSDNTEGGRISARGLAKAIGGKGVVYINSTNPNVSSVEGREKGFARGDGQGISGHQGDRPRLQPRRPEQGDAADGCRSRAETPISPASSAPTSSAPRARAPRSSTPVSAGKVQIVAYDATLAAIELLNKGDVSLVLAQKPFDMGYMAVEFAAADNAGVTSLPKRVQTGFAIIDKDNVKDPNYSRFIYKAK